MLKDINNLKSAFEQLNDIIGKQGKVSDNVYDSFKSSGSLDAQLNSEKDITNQLEKQLKLRQSNEKELNQLREQLQSISRTLSDQQNALSTGKKGKTPYDIANLLQQLQQGKTRAEELAAALGEDNEAVQHFRNGMDWTEANNPLRAMRDEAYKLIPEMTKLEQEITKLKESGSNENLLNFDEQRLSELKQKFTEIRQTFQEAADLLSTDKGYGEYAKELQQTVDLLDEQYTKKSELAVQRQSAINEDNQIIQKEKEYLALLQEKFELENKITQLAKDEKSIKSNQNQLKEYQEEVAEIQEKINKIQEEYNIEGKIPEKINEATQAHKKEQAAIEAKNKDIKSTNGLLSDTLKNFMKFTVYYTALNYLKQGIQQALETLQDLDAAFTDIRLVTGDTAEATAELAQEYNDLAKAYGSTTTDVAEGASEWLRQGKTTEETTELLKASMTLSKVGAMESADATEYLTSALNGYQLEASDAMSVVDKLSAVDLAAATSSEELAEALSRTANIANDSEVSFDKLIAMIGTVSSVTRKSASTIRRIF
jgi:DNA repair exonuclease SbcCD ATPase subunit